MNMQIPDSLRDEKRDKKLKDFASQKAYEAAANHVAAEVQAAPTTAKRLEGALARIDTLEKRAPKAEVTLKNPEPPKPDQRVPRALEMASITLTAEFLRRVDGTDPDDTIDKLLSGRSNELSRKAAKAHYKTSSSTALTATVGWGQELVASVTGEYWRDLKHRSALAGLIGNGARQLGMGEANSIMVPKMERDQKLKGSWVTEGGTIPVKSGTVSARAIHQYKLAVLSVFSNSLAETSIESLEGIIRDGMLSDTAEAIDTYLLDDDPGVAGVRPAGILNGAPSQPSAGSDVDAITADVAWLIARMIEMRAAKPVLLMHPLVAISIGMKVNAQGAFVFRAEIEGGKFFNIPVVQSENVPTDQLIMVNADAVMVDLQPPAFRLSDSATLVMIDDDGVAPTMLAPGAITTTGSVKVSDAATVDGGPAVVASLFQQDATSIRLIQPATWQMVRDGTAFVSGVSY